MKERLIFHGTSANIDSILSEGFRLDKCKRFAHGHGIYFSEFQQGGSRKLWPKSARAFFVPILRLYHKIIRAVIENGLNVSEIEGFTSILYDPPVDSKT